MLAYLLEVALMLLTYGDPRMTEDQRIELKQAYEVQDEDRLQITIDEIIY